MRDLPFVLLAAGRSERMGQPKALLEFHGKPWLRAQIDSIRAQSSGPIQVVLGPSPSVEMDLCAGLPGVRIVVNPAPERGPFSSLQAGLAGLTGPVFVGPLDCPVAKVLGLLLLGMAPGDSAVIPTHRGAGGHPVLLGAEFVAHLLALDPAARLDQQLRLARSRRLEVAEAQVTLNLNDPEAWERFKLSLAANHPGRE